MTQSAGEVEKVANVAAVAPVGQDPLQSDGRERKEGQTAARVDETRWNSPFRQDQSSYTLAQRPFNGGPQSAT